MSEYQISSVYFSRRNKLLLLICVFFFSCSTHVFKNVFPFLFMLTGVRNEIDLDNVANQAGRFPSRGGPLGGAAKGGGIQTDLFGQSAAYSLGRTPPTIVSEEATHSSTYLETKGRNSQSIYLYSNILTLIYCSSLVTYIFILVYDLGKKNYVINSFYIINLVAHFTIFLLLSDIQMRNTDLREVMSWRDGSLSRDAMPLFGRYPAEDMLAKRRDINFYFKRNLRDRLDAGEFLSVGLFQRSALEFVLGEDAANEESAANYAMLGGEERVDAREGEEQKRNVLLIPNYDDECSRNADYYDDWELSDERDDGDDAGTSFLSRADERNSQVGNKLLSIYQGINKFCSSFTFYFFFFIFIYAFLLSIMHIFINYFFYIYLFVFNINIYVSNVYTIIMTFVSLIAIPFSGYIVDNIGSFLSLLLCSSSFILVAISGSIYCYKLNQSISESIIPTVIISQIPTHLCVKNNESITSAFAIFELVTMIIISLNNYVFGCFLIKEEYLKGLYVLFFFVILVIVLILLLIVTIYLKKKRSARAYKSPRNADLAQPLL
ncbi:hypothetical protein PVMG_04957 [Plasmodium vivax Mauritania I]|uniref:Transporter n=1 Tax=Plasmodium vivax Mauritania I TaxID=1035515 RepID=A0A0J9TDR3_PLAVI|nr:hypothetical protein PVMG_04957 [Plasmodium vivax Mauritania I]